MGNCFGTSSSVSVCTELSRRFDCCVDDFLTAFTGKRKALALSAYYGRGHNSREQNRLLIAIGILNSRAGSSVLIWEAQKLGDYRYFPL